MATVVTVVTGVVGLLFVFSPDLQPKPDSPRRSVTLRLVEFQPHLTRRQYMQRVDVSPAGSGFTPEQLSERGAFVEYRYTVVGYKNEELPVKHELIDAVSGDQVSQAKTFLIEPLAAEDTGEWHAWVQMPDRDGEYYVLLRLYAPHGNVPLARLETSPFRAAP